jgi:hypothetical protein
MSSDEQMKSFRIRPTFEGDFPVIYSNFVVVSRTPNEYVISFCRVDFRPDESSEEVRAPAQVQIVMPPQVADGFISALQEQQALTTTSDSEADDTHVEQQ